MSGTFGIGKNHNGFSLVQTLIAVSIMGGLSLGTMTMLDTAQKSSRRMELRSVAGQMTMQVQEYLNAKRTCGENVTQALALRPVVDGELKGSLSAITRKRRDSNGDPILDESNNETFQTILETDVDRPDGIRVEGIEVVMEDIDDFPHEVEDYNKTGKGRIVIRMSYCEKGGSRCPDEKRKNIDKAVQLKEIHALFDDDGLFQNAICSSSQDGILDEAKKMVDEVQAQVCQLAFANAAINGDTNENPDCGSVHIDSELKRIEVLSAETGSFKAPWDMNLKNCRFKGVIPGTMEIALSGGGGGGGGSDKTDNGDGGKAGIFLLQNYALPPGQNCSYVVGKGGERGRTKDSKSGKGDGKPGFDSTLKCGTTIDLTAEGGRAGKALGSRDHGRNGENSELFLYLNKVEGGGGLGARMNDRHATEATFAGGGGGGAAREAGVGKGDPKWGSDGGDGALIITWKEYTVMPNNNIHNCKVCEPGTVLNENKECEELCSDYGEVYDESTNSCACGGNTISQGGSCVSCSSSYALGSQSNGSSCSCPSGQYRGYCDGTYRCMPHDMTCGPPNGGDHHENPVIE